MVAFLYGWAALARVLQRRHCRRRGRLRRVPELLHSVGLERARALDHWDARRALEALGLTAGRGLVRSHRSRAINYVGVRIRQSRQRHHDPGKNRRPRGPADHGRAVRPRVTRVDAGRPVDRSAGGRVRRGHDRRALDQRCLVLRHLDRWGAEGSAARICRVRSSSESGR